MLAKNWLKFDMTLYHIHSYLLKKLIALLHYISYICWGHVITDLVFFSLS